MMNRADGKTKAATGFILDSETRLGSSKVSFPLSIVDEVIVVEC